MKLSMICILIFLPFFNTAYAKDWVMLLGTEPNKEQKQRKMLFLQPQYATTLGSSKLSAGPFEGRKGIFNLNGPEFRDSSSLQIVRAFAMARGNVPKTNGKLSYFGMLDFGKTLMTGSERTTDHSTNIQLADLSLTLNNLFISKVRLGQFITPGSNEMMKAVHVYDFINFTNFTLFTMLDWNMPGVGDGTTANRPSRPNSGFRDIGFMLFDKLSLKSTEHTYSIMLGNGNGITRWENDGHLDIHWRYRLAWTIADKKKLEFVLWGTEGKRDLDVSGVSTTFKRRRVGSDLELSLSDWRLELGYGHADGVIFHGTFGAGQPGIVSQSGTVASFLTLGDETARGYQIAVNYDYTKQYTFSARYDLINYGLKNAANERIFDTFTLSTQYKFSPTSPTRLVLNYELRNAEAPELPDTHVVNQFLSGVNDRISLNLFWFI